MNRTPPVVFEEELNNIIYSYIQSRLTSPSTTSTPNTTRPDITPDNTVPITSTATYNAESRVNMLNYLINNYNSNMQTYQYNIGCIINLIEQSNREMIQPIPYVFEQEYQTPSYKSSREMKNFLHKIFFLDFDVH